LVCDFRIRAPRKVLVDLLTSDGGDELEEFRRDGGWLIAVLVFRGRGGEWQVDFSNRRDKGDDFNTEYLFEV
jgi:hypothetical protein